MPIKLLVGNLLDSQTDIILHGVNCRGVFASGVADQIKKKFPLAYTDYMGKHKSCKGSLGDVQYCFTGLKRPRFIVNCATQDRYGNDGRQYADYKAVQECVTQVIRFSAREGYSIGMPKIGCGLGGLNWIIVFNIINKVALEYPDVPVTIYSLAESELERTK